MMMMISREARERKRGCLCVLRVVPVRVGQSV